MQDYYTKYEGRDIEILNKHAAGTIEEDYKSFRQQVENHIAHVIMLSEQKIISQEDAVKILGALIELLEKGPGIVAIKPGLTDLYSNIEEWLVEKLGIEVGGKVHTGRSRNDMNSTIERMYAREIVLSYCEAVTFLMETLLIEAEKHKGTIVPGYTHHSQQAQPVTLGHFYMSAFSAFSRDLDRILSSYDRINLSTMGGAALATTSFPVNRRRIAELLGFSGIVVNSMDACSSLDFAYEPASAMAVFINNVGRMIESLLIWSLNEVGFCRLDLKYCSYSTIMPQKRNPVALETLRYSAEWTYGALGTMFNTMKGYTPGNGRSPGFVVSTFYEIAEKITESAYLLEGIIRNLEVDKDRGLQITKEGFSTMTDLADEIVRSKGLSFSAAKKIVGRLVVICHAETISIDSIDSCLVDRAATEVLGTEIEMPEDLIKRALDPVENVNRRDVIGGPNPVRVQDMVDEGRKIVEEARKNWMEKRAVIKQSSEDLLTLAEKIVGGISR